MKRKPLRGNKLMLRRSFLLIATTRYHIHLPRRGFLLITNNHKIIIKMANTYNQIYIHLVFAVKYRDSVIHKSWRHELYQYIIGLIEHRGHKVYAIGGMSDHIHILVSLSPKQAISELVQEVKRASSLWIKEKNSSNAVSHGKRVLACFRMVNHRLTRWHDTF